MSIVALLRAFAKRFPYFNSTVSGHEFLVDDAPLARPAIDMGGLVGHKQVTDFHLVDLVSRHGAVLATLDSRLLAVLAPAVRRCVELVPV